MFVPLRLFLCHLKPRYRRVNGRFESSIAIAIPLTLSIAFTGCEDSKKLDGPSDPDAILAEVRGPNKDSSSVPSGASKTKIDEILQEQLQNGNKGFQLPPASESMDSNSRAILQLENIAKSEPVRPAVQDEPTDFWFTDPEKRLEIWELIFVGNEPIGFATRRASLLQNAGTELMRNEVESTTQVTRGGQTVKQSIQMTSIEKRNGELNHLNLTVDSGRHRREINASISDGKLTVLGTVDGIPLKAEYTWTSNDRGPFAIEQSLLRRPIRENEIRLIRFFDPIINKVVDCRLESKDRYPSPTMLSDAPMLREISCSISNGDKQSGSTLWMDDQGFVLKSFLPEMDVRVFRVEPQTALAFSRVLQLKTVPSITCPVELKNLDRTQAKALLSQSTSMVYQLEHLSKDPYSTIPKDPFQRVTSSDARTSVVTRKTTAEGDNSKATVAPVLASQSSEWIQFETAEFQEWKSKLISESSDSESNTISMVKDFALAISKRYQSAPFDRQIRRSTELLQQTTANSLEHALLLAGLCRDAKIPARLALGYIFDLESDQPRMVLHSWVEFWSDGVWKAADSHRLEPGTFLDRIKMRDTYAEDQKLLDDVASTAQWMGEIKVRVSAPR